jgi:XTP/dITP diphosphohydrolase
VKLLIATRNRGKLREVQALLEGLPVELVTLNDFPDAPEVEEDGATLEENAAKKAREVARACGVCTVADDSGLFVDALDGRPGVRSARYAGPEPTSRKLCRKLLAELEGLPPERRGAHFGCRIAMADPDGRILLTAEGRVDGRIITQMRGTGGFGYDPVFYFELAGCTFAEMRAEEKNAVSHRARALGEFRRRLGRYLGSPPPAAAG